MEKLIGTRIRLLNFELRFVKIIVSKQIMKLKVDNGIMQIYVYR